MFINGTDAKIHICTDELVEVTPDAVRIRKKILDEKERFRSNR